LLFMQHKAIVSASFGGSVLEIFANQKTHIAHLDDPCFKENFELDPFLDFDERYSEIDVKSIGPEGCNTFFDVISALEHEAARLELNLLAAILERALDACLIERQRLNRNAAPFRSAPQHSTRSDEQVVTFRSVRAA